jgi:rubrerythrin
MIMSDKPTYLGLLNALAEGEWRGFEYLTAWAAQTTDEEVGAVLRKVAAREGEHAMTFAKRLNELGYEVRRHPATEGERGRAEIAVSAKSDLEKLESLGYGDPFDPDRPDVFDGIFTNRTIDPITGALLGRYIAEERDSERLLRECCASLRAREVAPASSSSS